MAVLKDFPQLQTCLPCFQALGQFSHSKFTFVHALFSGCFKSKPSGLFDSNFTSSSCLSAGQKLCVNYSCFIRHTRLGPFPSPQCWNSSYLGCWLSQPHTAPAAQLLLPPHRDADLRDIQKLHSLPRILCILIFFFLPVMHEGYQRCCKGSC